MKHKTMRGKARQASLLRSQKLGMLALGSLLVMLVVSVLASTNNGGSSLLTIGGAGVAHAQTQQETAPAPTAPSWDRPNLHVYLLVDDEAATGTSSAASGFTLQLYQLNHDMNTQKNTLTLLDTQVSDAEGRANFDAAAYDPATYYLQIFDSAGITVLLEDPNLPRTGPIGSPDPETRFMTPVSLTKGLVVYVNTYHLRALVPGGSKPIPTVPVFTTPASASITTPGSSTEASGSSGGVLPKLAVYRPTTKLLYYYPPAGSGLTKLDPAPSPTPSAATNSSNGSSSSSSNNTPTPQADVNNNNGNVGVSGAVRPGLAGSSSNQTTTIAPTTALTSANSTPGTGNTTGKNVGGNGSGGGGQPVVLDTFVPSNATALPTPTLECLNCVPTAIGSGSNNGGGTVVASYPQLTQEAGTVSSELNNGSYASTPSGGVRGNWPASAPTTIATKTVVVAANAASGSGSQTTPASNVGATASNSGGDKGSGSPILPLVLGVVGLAVVGLGAGFLMLRASSGASSSAGGNKGKGKGK